MQLCWDSRLVTGRQIPNAATGVRLRSCARHHDFSDTLLVVTEMLEQITSLASTFSQPVGSYRSGSLWDVQALGTIGVSDGPLAAVVLNRIVDEAAMLGQVLSVLSHK